MPKDSITKIDKYNLDVALEIQADLCKEWGDALAEAESDLDDLKVELDLVESEVAYAIRREPDKYALTKSKISEAMINRTIPLQPEYQNAIKNVNNMKRRVAYLKSAMKSLDQKKTSLETLAKLQLGGYYAEPKLPRDKRDQLLQREHKKFGVGVSPKKRAK